MLDVQVIGIVDSSPISRSDAIASGFTAFSSIEELIAQRIEAAIVAVPTSEHGVVAHRLIEAGCAVLVEKPLARGAAEAKLIIDAAKQRAVPLMVGYVERYNPAIEVFHNLLKQGDIGDIMSIDARRVGPLPPRIEDVDLVIDVAVHDLDMVAFLTERRLQLISAQAESVALGGRADRSSLVVSAGACIAKIESNWVTPIKLREIHATGTRGSCHVDYVRQELSFTPNGLRIAEPESNSRSGIRYEMNATTSLPVRKGESLARQDRAFVNAARGSDLPSPELALESLRIAEEALGTMAALRSEPWESTVLNVPQTSGVEVTQEQTMGSSSK